MGHPNNDTLTITIDHTHLSAQALKHAVSPLGCDPFFLGCVVGEMDAAKGYQRQQGKHLGVLLSREDEYEFANGYGAGFRNPGETSPQEAGKVCQVMFQAARWSSLKVAGGAMAGVTVRCQAPCCGWVGDSGEARCSIMDGACCPICAHTTVPGPV